jgi:DNA-binding NtrC family response regulator
MPTRVLVVDDEDHVLQLIRRMLERTGHEVETASNGDAAMARLEGGLFDAMLMDVHMPGRTGVEMLDAIRGAGHSLPVLMMSGQADIETAVTAVRKGAIDFIEKPLRRERLLVSLDNALRYSQLRRVNEALQTDLDARWELRGSSPAMTRLKRLIARAAPSEGRVLITGENGTGKELIARAVHAGSIRADEPFVKINCAAVPLELIESELFGHERGAFTGAVATRKGKFELAHRGTLLLDEVGDMPSLMQAKLLRVLQEGEFEPVGATKPKTVDVRVIAATNRDLRRMVEEGQFREDLYYRLNVVALHAPPLRERREDIPELLELFVGQAAERNSRARPRIEEAALRRIQTHDFPGNVRELVNLAERLVILDDDELITELDVASMLSNPHDPATRTTSLYRRGATLRELLAEAEASIIEDALQDHADNMTETARELGIERSHLYKKVRALGISRPDR